MVQLSRSRIKERVEYPSRGGLWTRCRVLHEPVETATWRRSHELGHTTTHLINHTPHQPHASSTTYLNNHTPHQPRHATLALTHTDASYLDGHASSLTPPVARTKTAARRHTEGDAAEGTRSSAAAAPPPSPPREERLRYLVTSHALVLSRQYYYKLVNLKELYDIQ